MDGTARLVFRDDEIVSLPPKVVDTLLILIENAGSVVDKETLLARVWPDTFVDENNLAQNISVLRRTLDSGSGPSIETVPKRGYRFVAPVRIPDPVGPPIVPEPEAPRAGSRVQAKWAMAVVLAVLLGVTSFYFVSTRTATIKSIAVLPFQNLSGDPGDEFLADGLTELLIGNLGKVGSLRVISRTTSMHFKDSRKKLPEIARELKVDAVLQGSVMRSGDRVRIGAQLILGTTDEHIWSEIYDRDLREVSGLQLDIARTIAREAHIKTSPGEQARLARRPFVNRAAFEEYLRGRHAWNKRSPGEIRKAIGHFQNAIDFDAAYAPAYAGLADAYNQLGTHLIGEKSPRETRPLAIAAASKAIAIDEELAEAHAALGFAKMYDWDWQRAERELRRAIELDPSYGPVRIWYASFLQQNGRRAEALAQARYALELDPLSLIVRTQVGWTHAHGGDFDAAIKYYLDVLGKDPNYLWGQWQLGQAYLFTDKHQEAIDVLNKAAARSQRNPAILGTLGAAYARAGRKTEAGKLLNELTELAGRRYVSPHAFTWIYLGLGDKDRSFDWLDREYEDRSNSVAWIGVWHMLDGYRSEPRYRAMMQRISLSPVMIPVAATP